MKVMLENGAYEPKRAHDLDAGYDIRTPVCFVVPAHDSAVVHTGIHVEIPHGCVGMVKSKSGLNVKSDLTSEGVVDAGYTGGIVVKLYNHGDKAHVFERGDKITQLVVMPIVTPDIEMVDSLEETDRGSAGFGSTGK